jgi:AcrR family transcriptional regulator
MTFSSQNSEDTRKTIIFAALDLFASKGYDATSVAEICQKADVSKGAFYYHFPSKQDLFLTLMADWLGSMQRLLDKAGQGAEDVPQALDRMASASGRVFEELDNGFPILLEFWTQASRQPEIWERAVEPYRHYLAYFSGLIESGLQEGSLAPAEDPALCARIVMAVVMGLLLQASFDPDGEDWHQVTRSGIHLLLKGMRRTQK